LQNDIEQPRITQIKSFSQEDPFWSKNRFIEFFRQLSQLCATAITEDAEEWKDLSMSDGNISHFSHSSDEDQEETTSEQACQRLLEQIVALHGPKISVLSPNTPEISHRNLQVQVPHKSLPLKVGNYELRVINDGGVYLSRPDKTTKGRVPVCFIEAKRRNFDGERHTGDDDEISQKTITQEFAELLVQAQANLPANTSFPDQLSYGIIIHGTVMYVVAIHFPAAYLEQIHKNRLDADQIVYLRRSRPFELKRSQDRKDLVGLIWTMLAYFKSGDAPIGSLFRNSS